MLKGRHAPKVHMLTLLRDFEPCERGGKREKSRRQVCSGKSDQNATPPHSHEGRCGKKEERAFLDNNQIFETLSLIETQHAFEPILKHMENFRSIVSCA